MGEYGWLRNFWQLGKLGQAWGKYERNGKVFWDVGKVKGGVGKCVGGAVGKCVWSVRRTVGSVLGWGRCGESGKRWGGVGNVE